MKKSMIVAAIVLCLLVTIVFAVSLTKEQRQELNTCKKGCLNESKNSLKLCDSDKKTCMDTCKNESIACVSNVSLQNQFCADSCQAAFNLTINQTLNASESRDAEKAFKSCKRTCNANATKTKKEQCDFSHCRNECGPQKRECVDERNGARLACFASCVDLVLNQTFTPPQNNTIPGGNLSAGNESNEGNKTNNHDNACDNNRHPPFC